MVKKRKLSRQKVNRKQRSRKFKKKYQRIIIKKIRTANLLENH